MALFQSWSPGIAFMPAEWPGRTLGVNNLDWTQVVGLRQSGGATFRSGNGLDNWFHVPIPTPAIINDTQAKLVQVFVMFSCGDGSMNNADLAGANITDIHVWDGPNRIATFGGFRLFGDHHLSKFDNNNLHKLPMPVAVVFGIEIAVHVTFTMDRTVTFFAAGADFQA